MLTIRHFKTFQVVANCLNMSQAAKLLYVSQPTVSQTILEIEKHYNTSLFIRYPKRIMLTEEGKVLLNHIEILLKEYERVSNLKLNIINQTKIRLGVTYTVSQCILPDIIEKTNISDPSIAFFVNESNTKTLEQLLLRNDLDFVITEGNIQNKDIIKVPVANDCLVLVCGRNHPFYGLDKIDIKQLNDENFVLREEGSSTRRTFEDEMINNNINYNIVWECASIEAVKRAIIQNKGMGVISARLIVDEILNGDLHIVKATEVIWKKDIFLCYHKNFKHLRSYQPFIDTTITYQSAGVKCPIVDELVDTSQHEEDMDDKG